MVLWETLLILIKELCCVKVFCFYTAFYAKGGLFMAVTRIWKVYGSEGHRQKESFSDSYKYDFSNDSEGTRIVEVLNSDITGTNKYSVVKITRDSYEECDDEFWGQVSDGIFENCATGEIVEITHYIDNRTVSLDILIKKIRDIVEECKCTLEIEHLECKVYTYHAIMDVISDIHTEAFVSLYEETHDFIDEIIANLSHCYAKRGVDYGK